MDWENVAVSFKLSRGASTVAVINSAAGVLSIAALGLFLSAPLSASGSRQAVTRALAPEERDRPRTHQVNREVVVSGTVVNEDGGAIADATIEATGRTDPLDFDLIAIASAHSSAAGTFQLSFSRPGNYQILASHPGRAPALATVAVVPADTSLPPLRMTLGPGRDVFGRVTDEAGQPIMGARIALHRDRSGGSISHLHYLWHADDDRYAAVTGAGGLFSLRDVPAGRFALDIRAPGVALPLVGSAVEVRMDAITTDLGTFALPRGEALAGRITNPSGRSVAGAQIWLVPPQDDLLWDLARSHYAAGPAATSGKDGRFSLAGFDRGFSVEVCHPGFLLSYLEPAASGAPLAVQLQSAASFSGRVVDAAGRSIPGAEIGAIRGWLQTPSDLLSPPGACDSLLAASVASDRQGRFTLGNVAPG